jgi:hypothetical protein
MIFERSLITPLSNRVPSITRIQARNMAKQAPINNVASVGRSAATSTAVSMTPALLTDYLPISILTDSYKATHILQYPEAKKMVAVSRNEPLVN